MNAIHFLRPYWLLAILPMMYLCWQLNKQNLVDNWKKVCDEHLLSQILITPGSRIKLPITLLALGCIISALALAGPSWNQETQPIYRTLQGTVIVLNLTPSMSESMGTTTRIDRARFKLLDYLNQKKEGSTGLVVYSDEAHVISPLTEDSKTIANFVPSLDPNIMPTFNDNTAVGLETAQKLFKQAGVNQGEILLVTDKVTNLSETTKIAASLKDEGYQLSILEVDSKPNSDFVKLANAGGGIVIPMSTNNSDIKKMLAQTKQKSWVPLTKKTDEKGLFWHDDGRWLVFLILPLALIAFRRGYL